MSLLSYFYGLKIYLIVICHSIIQALLWVKFRLSPKYPTLSQKKKQCIDFENDKKEIDKDVKIAESKRNEIQFDLEGLKQENNYVISFIDWYYELKKELWERYSIEINDFEKFTSVINDFRKNEFDVPKIIEKYISDFDRRQNRKRDIQI